MVGAWMCEKDPTCRSVLARHWPDVPCYEDVKEIHGRGLAVVDVLTAGSPCVDWSVAGRRAGLAGERTGLFFDFVRIADGLAPRWVLFENVPGLLSACSCPGCKPPQPDADDDDTPWVRPDHRGRDFAVVLGELSGFTPDVPAGGWRNAGVCCGPKRGLAWRVLDARHFGVPQRRRRVFIVGCAGDDWSSAAAVLLEPESCSGHTQAGEEPGPRVAGTLAASAGTGGLGGAGQSASAITSRLVEDTVGTLGGTPPGGGWRFGADEAAVRQLIPTLARCLTASERWDADTEDFLPVAFQPTGGTFDVMAGPLSPTIKVGSGIGIASPPAVAYPIQDGRDIDKGQNGLGVGSADDPAYTVTTTGSGSVAYNPYRTLNPDGSITSGFGERPVVDALHGPTGNKEPLIVSPAAYQCHGSNVGQMGTLRTGNGHLTGGVPFVEQAMAVRRLLPVECERLMAFPDGHTATGADGKAIPDSARYRMLGNAVVSNVVEWIGRRIVSVDAGKAVSAEG